MLIVLTVIYLLVLSAILLIPDRATENLGAGAAAWTPHGALLRNRPRAPIVVATWAAGALAIAVVFALLSGTEKAIALTVSSIIVGALTIMLLTTVPHAASRSLEHRSVATLDARRLELLRDSERVILFGEPSQLLAETSKLPYFPNLEDTAFDCAKHVSPSVFRDNELPAVAWTAVPAVLLNELSHQHARVKEMAQAKLDECMALRQRLEEAEEANKALTVQLRSSEEERRDITQKLSASRSGQRNRKTAVDLYMMTEPQLLAEESRLVQELESIRKALAQTASASDEIPSLKLD